MLLTDLADYGGPWLNRRFPQGGAGHRVRIRELQAEVKDMDSQIKSNQKHFEQHKKVFIADLAELTARVSELEFDLFVQRAVREVRLETTVPVKPLKHFWMMWRFVCAMHKSFDITTAKREMNKKVKITTSIPKITSPAPCRGPWPSALCPRSAGL